MTKPGLFFPENLGAATLSNFGLNEVLALPLGKWERIIFQNYSWNNGIVVGRASLTFLGTNVKFLPSFRSQDFIRKRPSPY